MNTPNNANDAYNLRGWYKAILDYASETHDPAPVYDFWWAVEGHRKTLGRGFYLDLWDLYDQAGQGAAAFKEADRELLRCYVCQINDDFVTVLAPTGGVPYTPIWKQRIVDLAAQGDSPNARRFLYTVLNLYAELYADVVAKEGRAEFERQLTAAIAAGACLDVADSRLLRPKEALTSRVDSTAALALVHILAFLYRNLDHFECVPLPELADRIAVDLGSNGNDRRTHTVTLLRLFRFWAADCDLFLDIFGDKCGYKFHESPSPRLITLPAYHGTDNYICLAGERNVGKTGFMFASEATSALPETSARTLPKLTVRHASGAEDEVEKAKKKWLAGVPSDTGNQSLYAQTSVNGLCRFTFYDIPGEELYHKDRLGPSPWLQDHFEKRKPCALLMMFDRPSTDANVEHYVRLVELLELHLGACDARYRDLPIYFVMNKADLLLVGDVGPRDELTRLLEGSEIVREGFAFPTLRYETGLQSVDDVLNCFSNTPACCRNLAFLNILTEDVVRLAPVVNACLQRGYSNLSFVYTTCLAGKDPQYGAVRALWEDLAQFIGETTLVARKQEYERLFITQIDQHFGFADELSKQAAIVQDKLALTNEALSSIVEEAAKTQGVADFTALLRSTRAELDVDRDLPDRSGYRAIATLLHTYSENKKKVEQELRTAIPAILRELGVPAEMTVTDILPSHYQDPLDTRLKPGPSGSTSVQKFLASDGYRTACKEFEKLLLAAVDKYNDVNPTEKVFGSGELTGALGALDGALWNADAVGRQEVRFHPRYGSLNTLCPYKDRSTTDTENAAMSAFGGGERLGQVIWTHVTPESWTTLIRLFKHFLPRYPQFAYQTRYDLDEFKAAALNRLRERRMKLDEQAESLTIALLGVWHQIQKSDQKPDEIQKHFQAKYLLLMLARNGFQVEAFLNDPIQFRADLGSARAALRQAVDALGWFFRDDKSSLAAQIAQFTTTVPRVDTTLYRLDRSSLAADEPAIRRRLDVAGAVFTQVSALVGTRWMKLQDVHAHAIPNFAVPQLVLYNRDLDDYVRARKFLILRERAQYLVEAGWLDSLERSDAQFVRSAIEPSTFQDGTIPNAPPEMIASAFKGGVQAMCAKDALWRYPVRA